MMDINTITTEELAEKLTRGDNFKLVMTFHENVYKAKYIPNSLNIYSEESAATVIEPSDEIVIYCVNELCQASVSAYVRLKSSGFNNIRRYSGGLEAWEAAEHGFEGEDVNKQIEVDNNFMK